MTVCIAAICGDKIITVSDSKVSFGGDYSADRAVVKFKPIAKRWIAMFSGADIMDQQFITSKAAELLSGETNLTDAVVSDALQRAYSDRLRKQIESQVLSRYGFDFDSFLSIGKDKLTETVYNELCGKISSVTLSLQFLVVGFDPAGKAHLVYVDGQSAPASYDTIGYCAIGSGMHSAMSTLAFYADLGAFSKINLATGIYCCCAAKFMAESASDVGKDTFLVIVEQNDASVLIPKDIERLRKAWRKGGAPRIPKKLVAAIPQMILKGSDIAAKALANPKEQ